MDEDEFEYILYDEDRDKCKILFKYKVFSFDVVSVLGFDKDFNIIYYKVFKDGYDVFYKMNLMIMNKELVFSDDNFDFDGYIFYLFLIGEVVGFIYL